MSGKIKLTLEKDTKLNPTLEINWSIVKDWKEDARYKLTITDVEAKDLYSACTNSKNCVLSWIKTKW